MGFIKLLYFDNPTDSDIKISDYLTIESGRYAIIIYANSGFGHKNCGGDFFKRKAVWYKTKWNDNGKS